MLTATVRFYKLKYTNLNINSDILTNEIIGERKREIIVFTDGSVSNTREVVAYVRLNCMNSRLFCVGIGSGCSTALVNGISHAAKGKSIYVINNDRMQHKVMQIAAYTKRPAVSLTKIEFGIENYEKIIDGPGVNGNNSVHIYENVRCLYKFKSKNMNKFFKTYEGNEFFVTMTMEVEGTIYNETKTIICTGPDSDYLHYLSFWCDQKIREITDQHSDEYGYLPEDFENKVIELSKKGNILHELTAFIGISGKENNILPSNNNGHHGDGMPELYMPDEYTLMCAGNPQRDLKCERQFSETTIIIVIH